MPEITELFERAAPRAGGPAPVDAIVRRGRRRKVVTRAAAIGAPLAVAGAVVSVLLTGSPTDLVIDPPPMADEPDPTPSPPPTEPNEPNEPPPDDGEAAESPDTSGWIEPSGLAADLLVVEADRDAPQVVRLGADGSLLDLPVSDGVPNTAGLLPDGAGGFVWQPDGESADPAPIRHIDADGETTTLLTGDEPGQIRLVGWDRGLGRPLATEQRGDGIENMTAELLSVPLDGRDAEVVRDGVGAWEVGVSHAAMLETALYSQYVEAMQNLVLDPPDGDPQAVYEAGESTGEYLGGVGVIEERFVGVALVGTMPGLEGAPRARLLVVDLTTGEVVDEVEVPLGDGFEGDTAWPGTDAHDVSIADGRVLVNRRYDGEWVAPLVYDTDAETWSSLEHRTRGPVTGRAFLAPAVRSEETSDRPEGTSGQAACVTEDADLRNAEPVGDEVSIYLPCKDEAEPWPVYRLPTGIEPTGDVTTDLTAGLELLIEPVLEDELAVRGYHGPADRGQVVLRSVAVEDGHAVIDVAFPDGVGNLNASHARTVWQRTLRGTVFQFEDVETYELRLDGSCEEYAVVFEGDGCAVIGRDSAPWNSDDGA